MDPFDLKQWEKFGPTDIADAIIKLKLTLIYLDNVRLVSPGNYAAAIGVSVAGLAKTVKIVSDKDNVVSPPKHFVDEADPNSILLISTPGYFNAVFGGLLATRAKYVGFKAAVISGKCRDLAELDQIGLPVFAEGPSILGAASFTKVTAINVPVQVPCGEKMVEVSPGDLIFGDINGVICVKRQDAEKVLKKVKELKEIDDRCMEELHNGLSLSEAFKKHRN